MPDSFLHERSDFKALVATVADIEKINDPALVEKDYWIMHAVYGLKQLGLTFELKGGTSLSKGFGIIQRFSEDIDIRIEPFDGLQVDTIQIMRNPSTSSPDGSFMKSCGTRSRSRASRTSRGIRHTMTRR